MTSPARTHQGDADGRRRVAGTIASLLIGAALLACRSQASAAPRYVVTAEAIDVGVGLGVCVAVDPLDTHGVWWWQPRGNGCAKRSTGPGVFHADEAHVARPAAPGPIALGFRLGTHSFDEPYVDIRLTLEGDELVDTSTGDRVRTLTRDDLIVPE